MHSRNKNANRNTCHGIITVRCVFGGACYGIISVIGNKSVVIGLSSRIPLQNTYFNSNTESSKLQQGSTSKNWHPKSFITTN